MSEITNLVPVDVETTTIEGDSNHVTVWAIWEGVDRPKTYGIQVRKNLVPRLKRAILDGTVFSNPRIVTDSGGQTYVRSSCQVLARRVNSDLKKLGY